MGENYFHHGQIILNKFKTSKKFKKRGLLPLIFTPSRSLSTLLRKYVEIRKAQEPGHDYLIFNKMMKPFKSNSFFHWLTATTFKYVGKKLGTSQMRKIYTTEFLATDPGLKQKQRYMRDMMQLSLETHESYRRVNMPLSDED
jgi:hypothetical protein